MKRSVRPDVVLAGLAVVDVIGRPVDLARLPRAGGLQLLQSVTLTTGGNVSNCGIDLAKLGFHVAAITRIGDDTLGEFVRREYIRHTVDTAGVVVDRRDQTSATLVAVDETGERTFLHTRGCLRNFRVADVLAKLPLIRRSRLFAFGYLGLLPESEPHLPRLFRTIKRSTRVTTLLDTGGNPRRQPALLRKLLPFVDIFIPSLEEAKTITGARTPEAIVRRLRDWGAPGVLGVKLGAEGCYVSDGTVAAYVPPVKVRTVVDATGAGDAFVAGFIAATLKGFAPLAATRLANAVASSCVTAVGASTAIQSFRHYQ